MNFKVRNEYFGAAQRHLAVCQELQKQIKVFQEKEGKGSSLSKSEELLKHQLLCDLYYLTGYVIECSCCTAIYHHFPNLLDKKDLKKNSPDSKYPKVIFKIGQNDNDRFSFFCIADKDHKLTNFTKAFLKDFLNTKVNIPLLNGETQIFQNTQFDLSIFFQYQKISSPSIFQKKLFVLCNFWI